MWKPEEIWHKRLCAFPLRVKITVHYLVKCRISFRLQFIAGIFSGVFRGGVVVNSVMKIR